MRDVRGVRCGDRAGGSEVEGGGSEKDNEESEVCGEKGVRRGSEVGGGEVK